MAGADTGGGQLSFVPGNCKSRSMIDVMNNKRSRTQRTRELITVMSGCLGQWRSEGGLRGGQNRREVINCRPSAIEPMNAFCIGPEADSTLPPPLPTYYSRTENPVSASGTNSAAQELGGVICA